MFSFNLILTIGLCQICLLTSIAVKQSGRKSEVCVCLTKYFRPIRGKMLWKHGKKKKKLKLNSVQNYCRDLPSKNYHRDLSGNCLVLLLFVYVCVQCTHSSVYVSVCSSLHMFVCVRACLYVWLFLLRSHLCTISLQTPAGCNCVCVCLYVCVFMCACYRQSLIE